jgi:hypothetical protein
VSEFVEALSAEFNRYADVVNKHAPKALQDGATPAEVLQAGRAALDARGKADEAAAKLTEVRDLIERVRATAKLPALGGMSFMLTFGFASTRYLRSPTLASASAPGTWSMRPRPRAVRLRAARRAAVSSARVGARPR